MTQREYRKNGDMIIHMAGHERGLLYFTPDRCQCGNIVDGVAFQFRGEGAWAIAYTDLKAMYEAATRKRQLGPDPEDQG